MDLLERAVALDHAGDAPGAVRAYKTALTALCALAGRSAPQACAVLLDRIEAFLVRAEELKSVAAPPEPKEPVARGEELREASVDDVVGAAKILERFDLLVGMRLRFPRQFESVKPTHVLLYGPPGTGKTMIARAVAGTYHLNFFAATSADVLGMYMGASEKGVRAIFEAARAAAPAMLFIDEVDSLGRAREGRAGDTTSDRVLNTILEEFNTNDRHPGVIVVGATNLPRQIDPALRRRFALRIHVRMPERADRASLFRKLLGRDVGDEVLDATEGFSNADVATVVNNARVETVRVVRNATVFVRGADGMFRLDGEGDRVAAAEVDADKVVFPEIDRAMVLVCARRMRPSVAPAELGRYADFEREFGAGDA